jgi:hypothetical protein
VETVAAAAARAAKVFLLRLPSGRLCLRGTDGITARLLPLFRLPNGGRACGLSTHRILPLRILQERLQKTWWEQGQAREGRGLFGEEDDGAAE